MSKRISWKNGIIHILLIIGGLVMLMPFYWMVATSAVDSESDRLELLFDGVDQGGLCALYAQQLFHRHA